MKWDLNLVRDPWNVQSIDNDPIDLLNESYSEKRSRYGGSARYQQALRENEYS